MTHTPTSGAADLPDAMHMAELLENPINVVCQKTAAAVLRHQHSELERLHALAAGQATAAQADSVLDDAARYRHLRDCNSGSLAVMQITGTDEDDWSILTEDDADAAIDAARKQGATP